MRKHKPKCNINTLGNYIFSLCMLAEYPLPYEQHLWPKCCEMINKDPDNAIIYLKQFIKDFKEKRSLKLHKMGFKFFFKYFILIIKNPKNIKIHLKQFIKDFKEKRSLKLHRIKYRAEHPCEYLFSDVYYQLISYIEVAIEIEEAKKRKMKVLDVFKLNNYMLFEEYDEFYRNEENEDIHLWWYDVYYGTYAHEGHVIYYTTLDLLKQNFFKSLYIKINKLFGATYVYADKI